MSEEKERINIVISKQALEKLDELKTSGGLANRGKAIEIMINFIYKLKEEMLKSDIDKENILTLIRLLFQGILKFSYITQYDVIDEKFKYIFETLRKSIPEGEKMKNE
jgi:metal-responsive CopG/Arc/MetJ family transcriptional regulator